MLSINSLSEDGKLAKSDQLSFEEYKIIQQFLNQSCGIVLGQSKEYLVKNRLSTVLAQYELNSYAELAGAVQSHSAKDTKIKTAVVDAMTTNETFWFRDDMQFVELREKIFPDFFENKETPIKVWSAACSSGQEPYTISMCFDDIVKQKNSNRNIQIIGTDISETILKEAKAAVYSEMSLSRGLDSNTKRRFFKQTQDGYKLNAEIIQKVRFQQFNLLKPFSVLGRFDLIFCRNVLIYFSDEVKLDILLRMTDSLEIGGYLFLSSTESMPASIKNFETIRNGRIRYYKKVS